MERFTDKTNGKAFLKCRCINGEHFQKLIEKLAEYEDLEENGLIKRKSQYTTTIESEINEEVILENILKQIISLTQNGTDFDISIILPAYCEERHFKDRYDGLFWGNEGATWKYKNDIDIVKLVDIYFVTYRRFNYPEMKHKNISICVDEDEWERQEFPCRYDYLKNQNNYCNSIDIRS